MKTGWKKLLSVLLILSLLAGGTGMSARAAVPEEPQARLSAWLLKNVSAADAGERIDPYLDWTVFALARAGYTAKNAEYQSYLPAAVRENRNTLSLSDEARIALAAMAVGMDASHIGGVNLIEKIENTDFAGEAYTGSIAYALIALDAAKSGNQSARTALKNTLIAAQRADGGFNSCLAAEESMSWTLAGETDSTGIALQALAPYRAERGVSRVISAAVGFLRSSQMEDGGFGAWGAGSAESTAMVLAGLCAAGKNPDAADFTVNGKTMAAALVSYLNADGGGRCWNGESDVMTSYQMLMGLSAYERQKNGNAGLFDLSCLSAECRSVEHRAFFVKYPLLGKIVCRVVSLFCKITGKPYFCCRHEGEAA